MDSYNNEVLDLLFNEGAQAMSIIKRSIVYLWKNKFWR